MKVTYSIVFFLSFVVTMLWGASSGYAEVYFFDDFESFANGDDIAEKSDSWAVMENAPASGIASTAVVHTGQASCVLEGHTCLGYNLALNEELPKSYVASVWYYHDAGQDPPPDANFVFGFHLSILSTQNQNVDI